MPRPNSFQTLLVAAAGALMLGARARDEIQELLRLPQLER